MHDVVCELLLRASAPWSPAHNAVKPTVKPFGLIQDKPGPVGHWYLFQGSHWSSIGNLGGTSRGVKRLNATMLHPKSGRTRAIMR
jgi:hypothetical protein